jgi:threonine dehydrogenase-like Zn-dependent dehydrogenase
MHGFKENDGGMAQYMLITKRALVHKMSHKLEAHHAAFVEPLSCSLHAVERANIKFQDVVVVAGAGPLGLGCVIGARQKGALMVIALDLSDEKLAIAKKAGADLTINIKKENANEIVKGLTDGYGADVYIEAVSSGRAASSAVFIPGTDRAPFSSRTRSRAAGQVRALRGVLVSVVGSSLTS